MHQLELFHLPVMQEKNENKGFSSYVEWQMSLGYVLGLSNPIPKKAKLWFEQIIWLLQLRDCPFTLIQRMWCL